MARLSLKQKPKEFIPFLKPFKDEIFAEQQNYPSVFNDGFSHIRKAIKLANYFNIEKNNLILDVGAANGIMAVQFAHAFPEAEIYSFEPFPAQFENLRKTAEKYKIVCINKAIGNKTGTSTLHLAKRITSSSLLPLKKNISSPFFAEHLEETQVVEISVSTLDAEVPPEWKVSILKIDVQGFELEVLKGGIDTLKRTYIVVLELQNHDLYVDAPNYYEVDGFLRNNGFELYDIFSSIRQENKLYEWDALYVNKKLVN